MNYQKFKKTEAYEILGALFGMFLMFIIGFVMFFFMSF